MPNISYFLPSSPRMAVLEVAVLQVLPNLAAAFEEAFGWASKITSRSPGYRGHELRKSLEKPGQYLLVRWNALTEYTAGFRELAAYQEWKQLLRHTCPPFPTVEYHESM
jgi:heme-degrading monooxygenase HmoA